MVIGRNATDSWLFTRCASLVCMVAGNRCTSTGTAAVDVAPTAICISSCGASRFHFDFVTRFVSRLRPLIFSTCFSMCSSAWPIATDISTDSASPTIGLVRRVIVISAIRRCFSAVKMTLLLKLSPRILPSLVSPVSTVLRMAGETSNCLPVISTFISSPPCVPVSAYLSATDPVRFTLGRLALTPSRDSGENYAGKCLPRRQLQLISTQWLAGREACSPPPANPRLLLYAPLVRAGYLHVFPVLRDRAASDLDTLRLEDAGDLLVR